MKLEAGPIAFQFLIPWNRAEQREAHVGLFPDFRNINLINWNAFCLYGYPRTLKDFTQEIIKIPYVLLRQRHNQASVPLFLLSRGGLEDLDRGLEDLHFERHFLPIWRIKNWPILDPWVSFSEIYKDPWQSRKWWHLCHCPRGIPHSPFTSLIFLLFFPSAVTPEKTGLLFRVRNPAPESHKPFNLQWLKDQRTRPLLPFGPLKLKAWNIVFFCHICFFTIHWRCSEGQKVEFKNTHLKLYMWLVINLEGEFKL